MAIIKDGNGGTDQAKVFPVSKAIAVTLVDTAGNVNAVPLATSTTGALESLGNLAALRMLEGQSTSELLRAILVELRIINELLSQGFNLSGENYERYRNDPFFSKIDTLNG
jgi:hypothetical protein